MGSANTSRVERPNWPDRIMDGRERSNWPDRTIDGRAATSPIIRPNQRGDAGALRRKRKLEARMKSERMMTDTNGAMPFPKDWMACESGAPRTCNAKAKAYAKTTMRTHRMLVRTGARPASKRAIQGTRRLL